uniref:Uncharacterized protein n=1 Tax=viral metagenome TaxID=1070528 RepID=A0A6C0JUF1_9ZZZZ
MYATAFKKTLQELINDVQGILKSDRYDAPKILSTDLKAAEIAIAACNDEAIVEIMNTFGKFVLQFETQILKKDVAFFNRLEICKACGPDGNPQKERCVCLRPCFSDIGRSDNKGTTNRSVSDRSFDKIAEGINTTKNSHKCRCDPKCPNCSDLLKELDSKTFNAIKYIIGQAVEDSDEEKKEDIDIIFQFISSLLTSAKKYKER